MSRPSSPVRVVRVQSGDPGRERGPELHPARTCRNANPEILGLGDLILNGARTRSSPGRLELTLYKPDANRHYHIALQLGAADERHLVRAVEHWGAERQYAPGSGHYTVVAAEEFPARLLHSARLLSLAIPLVVLRMAAVQTCDGLGLLFTRLLDVMAV